MRHAVIVITYRRPEFLKSCLTSLGAQTRPPDEVVVVDQSPDDESYDVTIEFPFARWVDNRRNAGRMTTSRNLGLVEISSDIVSFVDDDSMTSETWAETLLAHFQSDPSIGALGGRVDNAQEGEEEAEGPIGVVTKSGRVIGNFGAVRRGLVPVEHAVGANMSFRTGVLEELGGFRDDFPGTAMAEDTDMGLRVGRLGHRVVYAADVLVRHVSAPHVVGNRFDGRYAVFATSNYLLLARRNYGAVSTQFGGRLLAAFDEVRGPRSLKGKAYRFACAVVGTAYGIWLCLTLDGVRRPPLRRRV